MEYKDVERILQTYSLEEILQHNEITEEDLLIFLLKHKFIELPEILPIDMYD